LIRKHVLPTRCNVVTHAADPPLIDAVLQVRRPYVLFLGDVAEPSDAKTAFGLRDWSRSDCIGQMRLPGCPVDTGLPDLSPKDAAARGAGSVVIGVAPIGGQLQPQWVPLLLESLEVGLDVVSGMHTRLSTNEELRAAATRGGATLIDVRHYSGPLSVGNGLKRVGKRLLTVGTDCALGKKYTALAVTRELRRRGVAADFRATGQTGTLIAGRGLAVDAVVADFIAGAAELISPANDPGHWDVVEGQGSIMNPAYAGVSLGLLHGSQPDAFIVCHDPRRTHVGGMEHIPLAPVEEIVELTTRLGRLTNPAIRCVGVSLNTAALDEPARAAALTEYEHRLGVPAFDPMLRGVERVVDILLA